MRLDPRGLGLRGLGAADLAPFRGDEAVQRHVLRLERRDPFARLGQEPAERRRDQALADVAGGPEHHQRPAPLGPDGCGVVSESRGWDRGMLSNDDDAPEAAGIRSGLGTGRGGGEQARRAPASSG